MQSKINTMNFLNSYLINKEIERAVKDVKLSDDIEAELTAEQELSQENMNEWEDCDKTINDNVDFDIINESVMNRLEY